MNKKSFPHILLKNDKPIDLFFELMSKNEKNEFFDDLLKHEKIKLDNGEIITIDDFEKDDIDYIKKYLNQQTNKDKIEYNQFKHKMERKSMDFNVIKKLATQIIKDAMPMLVLDPTRGMAREILQALRRELNVPAQMKALWREYVTIREGVSNKFHYFVVFTDDNGKFRAANAYGRIGYTPKVFDLGTFDTFNQAKDVAFKKLKQKMAKGYQITSFDPQDKL